MRKAWQLDAANIVFEDGDTWNVALQNMATNCVAAMGLTHQQQVKVQPNLYKILIYEQAGHFQKKRDTEKEPGMLGTMVVQLPSNHEGGGLVISPR